MPSPSTFPASQFRPLTRSPAGSARAPGRHMPTPAALALLVALAAPLAAQATNGMLLEGYGPVATGMGGASTAYDNGVAAAANNPATLGLMAPGARLDLAVGLLGPDVKSQAGPMQAQSSGTSYVMPALGYARSSGSFTWGLALFAQGGMGTDYGADSFLAMGSGAPVRSELGVGRVMLPLAWKVNEQLSLGLSLDLVWSGLDLRMAASGAQLAGLVTGFSGNLAMALPSLGGAPWARIDFSDDSDYTGSAMSTGTAAKFGLVWSPSSSFSLGLSHHLKTRLDDMETGASDASISAPGGFADPGRITVEDFQMPAQTTVGLAWRPNPSLLVVADVKRIAWSGVMDSFRMRFDSAGMGGSVSFALPQRWKDQTVLQLGVEQRIGSLALRAGFNSASNPVPADTVFPLFPAIVEKHYTLGAGYAFSLASELNLSLTHAPEVTVDTPSGVRISHAQTNAQLMFSLRF